MSNHIMLDFFKESINPLITPIILLLVVVMLIGLILWISKPTKFERKMMGIEKEKEVFE